MNRHKLPLLLSILLFVLCLSANAQIPGQDSSIAGMTICWLKASDDVSPADQAALYFCNWQGGTYGGPDSARPNVKEIDGPPVAPVFDVRWTAPSRPSYYGLAHYFWDIRGCGSNYFGHLPLDTFAIRFSNTENPNANFTFGWDHDWLAARADSCFIIYFDSLNNLPVKIDMLAPADSMRIAANVVQAGVGKFFIYKYNRFPWCSPDGIATAASGRPRQIMLHQNYPNPFNPMTKIRFDVPMAGYVTVKVYDVLGQEIATLVSEEETPGYKEVEWDASRMGSGVYFYKLDAMSNGNPTQRYSTVRKMMVVK